jgi:DNA polymerase III, gamma/tau subunits
VPGCGWYDYRPILSLLFEPAMNYQVLARKWRPQNFTEVVGQDHVVKSLINGLQHNRLHHAYLFTGTRGVGKTTIARILAKAINCENLQDFNPCGVCSICKALDEGRFFRLDRS